MADKNDNMKKSVLYSVSKLSAAIDFHLDEYQLAVEEIEDELPENIINQIKNKVASLKTISDYLEALAVYNDEDLLNQMVLKSDGKFNLADAKAHLEEIMER
jgi:PBP1b-binding outer membrane lipoprotein LpoB